MSDSITIQYFNMSSLMLEIRFVGDNYETASVQFILKDGVSGRSIPEKNVTIPVVHLFDMSLLIGTCLRRTALQYELEVQEMIDKIEQIKKENKSGKEN